MRWNGRCCTSIRPNSSLTADGALEIGVDPTAVELFPETETAPDDIGPVDVMLFKPVVMADEHPLQVDCEQLADDDW